MKSIWKLIKFISNNEREEREEGERGERCRSPERCGNYRFAVAVIEVRLQSDAAIQWAALMIPAHVYLSRSLYRLQHHHHRSTVSSVHAIMNTDNACQSWFRQRRLGSIVTTQKCPRTRFLQCQQTSHFWINRSFRPHREPYPAKMTFLIWVNNQEQKGGEGRGDSLSENRRALQRKGLQSWSWDANASGGTKVKLLRRPDKA